MVGKGHSTCRKTLHIGIEDAKSSQILCKFTCIMFVGCSIERDLSPQQAGADSFLLMLQG